MAAIVTWGLIGVTGLVSWRAFGSRALLERLMLWPPAIQRHRQYDRLLTHGFVHADVMHLLFNMVTLYFFGIQLEPFFSRYIGAAGYLGFYLSAIVVAILPTYLRHRRDASYRSLGASGAVSAVLFAFILLAPWAKIYVFLVPIGIPAFVFGALYLGYTIWMDRRGGGNINHSAHLWGAVYGMLFTVAVEPRAATTFLERLLAPSA
jgi:membrane associated rhomboid family serine protease